MRLICFILLCIYFRISINSFRYEKCYMSLDDAWLHWFYVAASMMMAAMLVFIRRCVRVAKGMKYYLMKAIRYLLGIIYTIHSFTYPIHLLGDLITIISMQWHRIYELCVCAHLLNELLNRKNEIRKKVEKYLIWSRQANIMQALLRLFLLTFSQHV